MRYWLDAAVDGARFETGLFSQSVGPLAGDHRDDGADEVAYVLAGRARGTAGDESHEAGPAPARVVARGVARRGLLPRRHACRRPREELISVPRIERSATVSWAGSVARGSGAITADTGAFAALPFSLPSRIGDPEGKTSPEELLAAAT